MAKRKGRSSSGVNVSEQIRTAWDADRSAKPAAIAEQLGAKGISASPTLVSSILSQYRKKLGLKGKKHRGRQAAVAQSDSAATANAAAGSIGNVIEAFKLVSKARELVGAEGLRQIVKAM